MKLFHLDAYKETRKYLYLFDSLMKDENINKEYFLKDLGINPGSYRRAKLSEQKIGKEIIAILSKKYNFNLINNNDVDNLEELINNIYYEINYKNYENYNKFLLEIEKNISKRNLLYPIHLLFKLFLLINLQKSVKKTIEDNKYLFEELQRYSKIFTIELLEIYDYLTIAFSDNIKKELLSKNYSSGLSYSIISTKLLHNQNYYESLYFANKAKAIFLSENNYKRVIYINFCILNNLSFTLDFEEYNKLAHEQYHTIKSFNENSTEVNMAIKHLVVSLLALSKYKEVIHLLNNKEEVTITEMFALIIAKYYYDNKNFHKWYQKEMEDLISDDDYSKLLSDLLKYLKNPEKKNLLKLKNYEVMSSLINVLKYKQ